MRRILKFLRAHKKLTSVLLVIGLIGFFLFRSRANGNGTLKEDVVARGTVEEEIVLTGEINASEYAALHFNTPGTISWVGVKVGDRVLKGQALIKLDTVKLNAAYQVARANYRAAEANAQEVLESVKDNDSDESFAEKNTRTAAETARDKAWDALLSAEKDLRDATLVAPFAGIVAILNSESAGVNIMAATPQVVIVNPGTIYFEVNADQTEVSSFKVGDRTLITLDAFDEEKIEGQITSISIAPDTAESGTVYPIRISLNLEDGSKYKVAMTGDAQFVVSKKDDVFYVPSGFISSDQEGDYVLVNGGRDKKYIEVGIEGEDRIEISGDISEGEPVFD